MTLLAIPFPDIDPVAIALGPIAIKWYGLAYIAGLALGWAYIRSLLARPQLWPGSRAPFAVAAVDDLFVWVTLGVVIGGRLGHVLFYDPLHYMAHPLQAFAIWQGGMSFHGGFLGVVVAMLLFAWRRRLSTWTLFDVVAAATPIGLFFGRIANFINGELWGRPADVAWAMVFPGAGPEPRHPSQLYEACLEGVALFLVLLVATWVFRSLRRPGLTAGLFAVGYGVARIIGEQFRMPDAQIGFLPGGLTMGMALSIPMIVVGAWAIWRALSRPRIGDETPTTPQ